MVTLRTIDAKNFDDVLALSVLPQQREFVAGNAESIAQTTVQADCHPFAIYANEVPVGFAMYCLDADDGEYWLYRLMVDAAHQSKGYGKAAMHLLLEKVKADPAHHKMYLGVHLASKSAVALYKSLGFVFDGRVYGGEHIMMLEY